MKKNQVIYEEKITAKEVYEGCSFRVERLIIFANQCIFENCNFNCSEILIIGYNNSFTKCIFLGEVYIHDTIFNRNGTTIGFNDCKIKKLTLGNISMRDFNREIIEDNLVLFKIKELGLLSINKHKFLKVEEEFELEKPGVIYNIHFYYFLYNLIKTLDSHEEKYNFQIEVDNFIFDGYKNYSKEMGYGFEHHPHYEGVLEFRDKTLGNKFAFLRDSYRRQGKLGDPFFIAQYMLTREDMARLISALLDPEKMTQIYAVNNDGRVLRDYMVKYREEDLGRLLCHLSDDISARPYDFMDSDIGTAIIDYFGFRLPDFHNFQFAAEGESKSEYWWGSDLSERYEYEVYNRDILFEVGKRKPNVFGLYDMLTNMPELVNSDDSEKPYSATGTIGINHFEIAEGQMTYLMRGIDRLKIMNINNFGNGPEAGYGLRLFKYL